MTRYLSTAIKNYAANYAGLPTACWQGIFLTFVNAISVGICFFLSLYFVDILHFNIATAGVMISAYGLGTVIGGIAAGKLSDQIFPTFISIGSLFIQAIAFLLLTQLHAVELIIINLFILGMATY